MHGEGRVGTTRGALALVFLAALAAAPAAAGDMTPDFGPDAAGSRMKTLQQVWEKVTTGAVTTADPARPYAGEVDFDGSMHDLNEIFGALPSARVNGALEAEVCSPATFWGLRSTAWGGLNAATPFRSGSRDCAGPVLADPPDQTISENGSASFSLTVADPDRATPDASLVFLATSSNTALLPAGAVAFAWDGTAWDVTLTPVAHVSGSSTVTIQAVDLQGNRSAAQSLTLTVNPVNQQPTVSAIGDQTTDENVPTSVIPFFVGDDHTAAASLSVGASSSNAALVPGDAAHLVLAGSGTDRSIKVVPADNASGGPVTITITVTDGGGQSRAESFTLTVNPVNQAPAGQSFSRTVTAGATVDLVTATRFSDPDSGDTLSLHLVDPLPGRGTAAVAAGPKITYTGASTGSDTVNYAVCDAAGLCDIATVSVTVNP